MSRNENTRFALNPTNLDIARSTFRRDHSVKLSFNVGDVIPFYVDEVLPGDTFQVKTSMVVRLQTLLTPMMDNLYLDTYFYFVPNRIVWQHWRELMGENTQSAWIPTVEYSVPQVSAPAGGWSIGSIADYMGVPTGVPRLFVNALPFRAYALIMNEWFRDENLSDPLNIPVDDATLGGSNGTNYITDVVKGGMPFKAAKFHDYFTSALPAPQKGPDVTIPVGQGGNLPVVSLAERVDHSLFKSPMSAWASGVESDKDYSSIKQTFNFGRTGASATEVNSTSTGMDFGSGSLRSGTLYFDNLWALQSGSVTAATINQLRMAFQVQKLYEKDARGGTRYIEILKSHFGVTSPDARLQRPEYLGGNRIPVNINQVVQSSATQADGTPLGDTAAFSVTTDVHGDFIKSFVEHGFVIGVMVARYDHTYQQGLERFWSRKDRLDYYFPVFANIGEQPILNKEIYAQGTTQDDEVFGYQEAWADYRYKPSRVAGEMRSQAPASLDVWHLADEYTTLPKLSDAWIREDKTNVDRVLAVTSSVSNQMFADLYIQCKATRPMPVYSIPGLIDHH
ncbi:major capsid protein [Staphylococcus aureus]|uniref:major capsid protein n=1 Tax=Staphylococcus aureus TaxID=1280 RepID=UPI0013DBDF3B|nr:major capsid protein [Staphylococcus aureus]